MNKAYPGDADDATENRNCASPDVAITALLVGKHRMNHAPIDGGAHIRNDQSRRCFGISSVVTICPHGYELGTAGHASKLRRMPTFREQKTDAHSGVLYRSVSHRGVRNSRGIDLLHRLWTSDVAIRSRKVGSGRSDVKSLTVDMTWQRFLRSVHMIAPDHLVDGGSNMIKRMATKWMDAVEPPCERREITHRTSQSFATLRFVQTHRP